MMPRIRQDSIAFLKAVNKILTGELAVNKSFSDSARYHLYRITVILGIATCDCGLSDLKTQSFLQSVRDFSSIRISCNR